MTATDTRHPAPASPGPPGATRRIFVIFTLTVGVLGGLVAFAIGSMVALGVFGAIAAAGVLMRTPLDPPRIIAAFLVLSLVVPSSLVIPELASVGSPALLFGVFMMGLWLVGMMFNPDRLPRQHNPLFLAMTFFLASALVSYAWGLAQELTVRVVALDRGLLFAASFVGSTLFCVGAFRTFGEFVWVIRVMSVLGAIVAAIGMMQSAGVVDVVAYMEIPGLQRSGALQTIGDRYGATRVTSTAKHPIEYSVVLAGLFPIALVNGIQHFAKTRAIAWLVPPAMLAMALPTAVSRSGVVSMVVAVLIVLPALRPVDRRALYYLSPLGIAAVTVLFPNALGSIRGLFLNWGTDTSISTRVSDYGEVEPIVRESPFFGRGLRTLDASEFLLDNQILHTAVETGFLGLLAWMVFFIVSIGLARGVRVRTRELDPDISQFAQAIVASQTAFLVSFFTFDATHYPMVMGLTAVLAGMAASLWLMIGGAATPPPRPKWLTALGRAAALRLTRAESG